MSWSALPFAPAAAGERLLHDFGSGRATLGARWQWSWSARSSGTTGQASQDRVVAPVPRSVTLARLPESIRRLMSEAAEYTGRDEGDLWVEAAGDWLRQHAFDNDPIPPAPAAALALPRRTSSWDTIDGLLTTLRQAIGPANQVGTEQAA